jgi:hypothetical protein
MPDLLPLLVSIHNFLDELNSKYGDARELCLYCHSKDIDNRGIIHKQDCIIRQIRIILDKEMGNYV